MVEFLVPLSSAVFVSGRNVLIRTLRNKVGRTTTLFTNFLVAGVFSVVILAFALPAEVEPTFYWAVPLSIAALIAGRFSLITALSSATLSSTIPLIAFAPLFTSLTSFLILGETITPIGLYGILAVVAGSYLLRIQGVGSGVFEPIRILAREKGARMMLLAALCFSLSIPFVKLAIRSSSTYVAFASAQLLGTALIAGWLLARRRLGTALKQAARYGGRLTLVGVANFLQAITTYLAVDLMLVAYASGIKGSNILITALLGHLLFGEKRLVRTLVVGTIMVAGVVLISLG
ncbi:MAG TPA: DMT family transporter [Spirochaetia bacterium]|nr:DMT family transporter [Spirochaetia bacterium]